MKKRILIAGTNSGCGKTTIVTGLLKCLINRGYDISAFKCGPDYIDPMFHREILGIKSENLDVFLFGEEKVKERLFKNKSEIIVIEGVMGFYDGMGKTSYSSSKHISEITNTTVVLVVDVKGKSLSICAEIEGFLNFEKNNIKGIILNNCSEKMHSFYKEMIEEKFDFIQVVGYMPKESLIKIENRQLGLEISEGSEKNKEKIEILCKIIENTIDWEKFLKLSEISGDNFGDNFVNNYKKPSKSPKIGVFKDVVFSMHYEDNYKLLEDLGAEIIYISPVFDKKIADNVDGIFISGGYPEIYAKELSNNLSFIDSLKALNEKGIPVYAESGGFLYLHEILEDLEGNIFKMSGLLKGKTKITTKLQNFGYITITANQDNIFCNKGDSINAHEFHYSITDMDCNAFVVKKASKEIFYNSMIVQNNILAGFSHINFYSNTNFAKKFIDSCLIYASIK